MAAEVETFGPYTLIEKVGQGGMGEVWKAKDDQNNVFALKIIRTSGRTSEVELRRFQREADILSNLQHHGICRIHDVGMANNQNYIAMEFLDGSTLQQILKLTDENSQFGHNDWSDLTQIARDIDIDESHSDSDIEIEIEDRQYRVIPTNQAIQLTITVCDAVIYAHDHGVLHRDLKPGNIIITPAGSPVVLDFGIAKIENEDGEASLSISLTGQVLGTFGYMAPEQAGGDFIPGKSADVYALGAILYQMVCGRRQYNPSGKIARDAADLQYHKPIPPRKHNPDLPRNLETIILKSLQNDAFERYQNVRLFRDDLIHFMNGERIVARRPSLLKRTRKWIDNNQTLTLTSVVIAFLLSTLVTYYLVQRTKGAAHWGEGIDIMPRNMEDLQTRWNPVQENRWTLEDGKLTSTTGGSHFLVLDKDLSGDVAIEFNGRIKTPEDLKSSGDLSAMIAYNIRQKHRVGYYLQLGGQSNRLAAIQSMGMGIQRGKPFTLEADRTYRVRAEKSKDVLKIFCDGQLILKFRDLNIVESGKVGIYTYGPGKQFWDIRLYRRGLPEHASPLSAADALYHSSRNTDNQEESVRLMREALLAYSLIVHNHQGKSVAYDAMRKRIQIHIKLKNINMALQDLKVLKLHLPKEQYLRLELKLEFMQNNWQKAGELLEEISEKYHHLSPEIFSSVMDDITLSRFGLPKSYRRKFLKLTSQYSLNSNIRIQDCGFDSLEFLTNNQHLIRLDCSFNPISDLSPIANSDIVVLNCNNTEIESLEPIKNLPLLNISARNTLVTKIPKFNDNIHHINLDGTPIEDISTLKNTHIKSFKFNFTRIKDLEPLRGVDVIRLYLRGTPVKDLSHLSECHRLDFLNVNDTRIKNISPLADLPITMLYLANTPIKDFSPIASMKKLKSLSCRNTAFNDLRLIKSEAFKTLDIGNTAIEDLSPLKDKPMTDLLIQNTRVRDLSPLTGKFIRYINGYGTKVTSLKGLDRFSSTTFFFDLPEVPIQAFNKALSKWELHDDLSTLVFNTRVALAIRNGYYEHLRIMATPFKGHRYLKVVARYPLDKAKAIAKAAGAKLLTITSAEEHRFIRILTTGFDLYYMLAIEKINKKGEVTWSNGEKSPFHRMHVRDFWNRTDNQAYYFKVGSDYWERDRSEVSPFILEWDE